MKASAIFASFILASTVSVSAAESDLQPLHLKISGGTGTTNMSSEVYAPFFKTELTEKSGGAITTSFGSLEEVGIKGPEVLRLLRLGMFDISHGTIGYMAGEDPRFDALDLPGVTLDLETQRKAVEAYKPRLEKLMAEKFNAKLLTLNPMSLQVFYCKGETTGLESLAGRQVRVFSNAMADFINAAGGSAVNLPLAEVTPALQRGVVDCVVTGTSVGNTSRLWEATDHLLTVPMGWSMVFFAANLESWNRLNPATAAFLEKELAGLEDRMWAQAKSDIEDGIECNTGTGPCDDGIAADPAMKLVEPSKEDKALAQKYLTEQVLPSWVKRCGVECAQIWNETFGEVAGVKAPTE